MTEKKIGLKAIRSNKTNKPENIIPENSSDLSHSKEKNTLLPVNKKRLTTNELPKSIRIPLDTHVAITTIATIEDKRIYEVINNIVENYIENMTPSNKKIVKNSVKAVQDIRKL